MVNVKTLKTFGKHPNIGWWFGLAITPVIDIARCCDYITETPVYCLTICWLCWKIEINNNKSY